MHTAYIIGAAAGALAGGLAGILIQWHQAHKAAQKYPPFKIKLPSAARYSDTFGLWAQQNRYRQTAPGTWRRDKYSLFGITEIRFIGDNEIEISEIIHTPFKEQKTAINAPLLFGRAVRAHKIKQLNKLLAYWQLPQIPRRYSQNKENQ